MHELQYTRKEFFTYMQTRSVIKLAWAPLAVASVLFALWVAMLAEQAVDR
jgi:hypothetical protein